MGAGGGGGGHTPALRAEAAAWNPPGPTHSVCSLGRCWNADRPTDWIGLS